MGHILIHSLLTCMSSLYVFLAVSYGELLLTNDQDLGFNNQLFQDSDHWSTMEISLGSDWLSLMPH